MGTRRTTRRLLRSGARLEELKAATRAIGDTAAERLAWVLRFIGEEPGAWHPAVRLAQGDCLYALARPIPDNFYPENVPDPLPAGEVEALHRDVRAMLRDLLGSAPTRWHQVSIPTAGQTESLVRLTRAGEKPAAFTVSYGHATVRTAVFQAVKDLVLQAGDRLIACPVCGAPFIAVRKQMFCGPRCAQRVRNERRDAKRARKTERRRKGGR